MKIIEINEDTYFKTELGSIISWYELKTSVEVCYGNRWNYIYNDFNIYIGGLINEGYIKVEPITLKQGYDYALNKGDKIKAIKLYWKLKNKNGKYYSLTDAKNHVEKILKKRNKKGE